MSLSRYTTHPHTHPHIHRYTSINTNSLPSQAHTHTYAIPIPLFFFILTHYVVLSFLLSRTPAILPPKPVHGFTPYSHNIPSFV